MVVQLSTQVNISYYYCYQSFEVSLGVKDWRIVAVQVHLGSLFDDAVLLLWILIGREFGCCINFDGDGGTG